MSASEKLFQFLKVVRIASSIFTMCKFWSELDNARGKPKYE